MRNWLACLALVGSVSLMNGLTYGGDQNCGCDQKCGCDHKSCGKSWSLFKCCCKSSCNCNCGGDRQARAPRSGPMAATAPPRAVITESMPMYPMSAGFVAMPMMMAPATRQVVYDDQRSRSEPNCSGSKDRLDALEAQVDSLNLRMKVIQRSVELQTRILEEMKAEGNFPKRYLGKDGQ